MFLGLTGAEEHLVEMKLARGIRLRKAREQHKLTQNTESDRSHGDGVVLRWIGPGEDLTRSNRDDALGVEGQARVFR